MQEIKTFYYIFLENIEYYSFIAFLFVATLSLFFSVILFFRNRKGNAQKRLDKHLANDPQNKDALKSRPQLLQKEQHSLAARLSKPLQKISSLDKKSVQKKLRLKLVQGGYRNDSAMYNFLAAKIIVPIIFVLIYFFTTMFYTIETETLLNILILLLVGFFTPNIWLFLVTKTRQERIFKGLPDALDLMVVCVESGLGIDMTMKRVGDEIRPLCRDLSDEFMLCNLEIRAGRAREDAFQNVGIRTDVSEVRSLMTVLNQTSRFGTNVAKALRVHADSMRTKRRQLAEETAAKSTVKLVFPLVLFIFPAIFVVLIGPGAIKIMKHLLPALGG